MKALFEIIEYLERRDRLDAATKRGLVERGVPLALLYGDDAPEGAAPEGGWLDAVISAEAAPTAADRALDDLETLEERERRAGARAGKGPKPKRPEATLDELAAALAAGREAAAARLAAFGDLAAVLGGLAPAADRAALRVVIDAEAAALAAATAALLDRSHEAALRSLCAAMLEDYHLPLAEAARAHGASSDGAFGPPLPAGPALKSYRMLLETMDPGAASLVWVLRREEVAFGFDLAQAQRRLVPAMRRALAAAPRRFAAPVKPFEPGYYGLLCGLLTAEADDGATPSAGEAPSAAACAACVADRWRRRAFGRGLALGYGAGAPGLDAATLEPDHPLALLAALGAAETRRDALAREQAWRLRAPRCAADRARQVRDRADAATAASTAARRLAGRLRALKEWALAAPREATANG